jgi:UPF0271 protein
VSDVIDLNADVGEECGDDEALFGVVTSANVAAGGHAGGGVVLDEAIRLAVASSVAIGAHPSYPDLEGFGRVSRAHEHDRKAIASFVHEQSMAVASACARHGVAMSHVKAHGALYNDAMVDDGLSDALLDGLARTAADAGDPGLPVMGMPGSSLHRACLLRNVPFIAEAFADRAYAADGTLVPRTAPGAVLHETDVVVHQVLRIVCEAVVIAVDGSAIRMSASSICVHGDTPGAVGMAREVRSALEGAGIRVVAPSRWP